MSKLFKKYFYFLEDIELTIFVGLVVVFVLAIIRTFVKMGVFMEILKLILSVPLILFLIVICGMLTRMLFDTITNKINKRGNQ